MTVHIVGAGLAGLSCAVRLARQGRSVVLHEAASAAGGRCRTLTLGPSGRPVDTGLHLLLSQNRAAFAYLDDIGARPTLAPPLPRGMEFVDIVDGIRWHLRPARGPIPWWTLIPGRSAPGSGLRDWLAMARIRFADPDATVARFLPRGTASVRRLWEPSVVAALNTTSAEGSARAYWSGIRDSLGGGGGASHVTFAREGLSATFVDPALVLLRRRGAELRTGARLRALDSGGGRVTTLRFDGADVALEPGDAVVLALPPALAAQLVPALRVPSGDSAIVTVVYHTDGPLWPEPDRRLFALVGDRTIWVLVRERAIVATIGAADDLLARDRTETARHVWRHVAFALGRDPGAMPDWDLLAAAHGTFAQTPANVARRAPARTALANLFLAGDWTDTGFPASVESAVRSGHRAAALAAAVTS